ncbi:MAG TPA: phenylalanine--tRNA ligase subunit beta [Nitrosospira sp.]|nr:phenylalanine--tRNA ligase subunit beta [Nitrosospira sp.]
MKFSENWLRTFVNPPLSTRDLAHALTMAGLEVESIEPVAPAFDKIVVAEVLSVQKHPDADHLQVCEVKAEADTAGNDAPLQIVCGAANVRAGIKVPCALPGAQLPGMTIKQARIRGVESAGMLCSAKELGLEDAASGLLLLPPDAPVGTDFRAYYDLEDNLLALKLTPNRGDCLGLSGIAREVAAITSQNLQPIEIKPVSAQIAETLAIHVDAAAACPLYCGRVVRGISLDVTTPQWMVQRLERSGLRAINAVVDVTNYVMLETGQPLHAFDLARIQGSLSGSIHIRFASSGEIIELLNGENLVLQSDMLVIADEARPLALAGIMGGNESGVTAGAVDLFLESAFFSPDVIAGKSFSLGFSSDSAYRFERGVDFGATRAAMERATDLILDICGGRAGPITEIRGTLPARDSIRLRLERVGRVLGVELDEVQVAELLHRLQFRFSNTGTVFYVTPPTYRFDLAIEEDLIEELARVYGYNNIAATMPQARLNILPSPETRRTRSSLRQILVARDYQEVINYAFVETSWEAELAGNKTPIALKNPLSNQLAVMRSSLLGGLVSNLQFNLNRKQSRVRLFEIGGCFQKDGQTYSQQEKLAGLCYGDVVEEQWGLPARPVDFYDAKADIEALLWPGELRAATVRHPALHPGKSAEISVNGRIAGFLGELHPRWQQKLDLVRSVVLFELNVDVLLARTLPKASEISKYPPIRRDIAVLVPRDVSVQAMLDSMQSEKLSIISEIALFDVYQGKGVESGKKSLAFRMLLQDTEKTLTDAQADQVVAKLISVLENKFGARLRS